MPQENSLKVVLVGDSGVGKSTIAARLCGERFNPVYIETREKDVKYKDIVLEDRRKARLQIWDTPGSEAFRTITAAYINKGIKGVIVVFDVTSEESFDNVQHWMRTVQEFSSSDSFSIAIVGNKTDKHRKVTHESGEKLACNKYNVRYFETSASAKTSEDVEKVFREITEDIIRKSETPHCGVLPPPTTDPELVKQERRRWCTVL